MIHVKDTMMKKISNIKKKNNKYIITLDDNTNLELYLDVLIKFNLLKPRELSDREYKEIIEYNIFCEAYNKALRLLNIKQRTKKELETKLKDYSKEVLDKVINKCEEMGFLNEMVYVESYISDQINLGIKGPNYIKRNLEKLITNNNLIEEILNNIDEDIWLKRLDKIISKKMKTYNNLSKNKMLMKLKSYLISLGYEMDMVNEKVNSLALDENTNALEKEYQKELIKLGKKYTGNELKTKLKYNLYKKGYSLEYIDNIISKNWMF